MTDLPDTCMFTVYIGCETIHEDDVVVARNLSGADAIKAALELGGSWIAHPGEDEYETFRLFSWRPHARKWPEDRRRLDTVSATVIKTADRAKDHALGTSMIVDQFIRRSGQYSKARIEADQAFDRRLRNVAKRREAHRLDKLIATALVDALLADGYVITDASYEEFERSTERDAILALLFDIETIELIVEKRDEESWMRLIFGDGTWCRTIPSTSDTSSIRSSSSSCRGSGMMPTVTTSSSGCAEGDRKSLRNRKDAEVTEEHVRPQEERFLDEMVEGYLDGRKADNPEPSSNRSLSYRHGFANGRDDLAGSTTATLG
jgi:hypothetical protein